MTHAQTRLLVQLKEFDLAVREAKEALQRLEDRRLMQARVEDTPLPHGGVSCMCF